MRVKREREAFLEEEEESVCVRDLIQPLPSVTFLPGMNCYKKERVGREKIGNDDDQIKSFPGMTTSVFVSDYTPLYLLFPAFKILFLSFLLPSRV